MFSSLNSIFNGNRMLTSFVVVLAVGFFSVYSIVYLSIFKENMKLGTSPIKTLISKSNNDNSQRVLGESNIVPSEVKNPDDLRMKSAALDEQANSVTPEKKLITFGVAVDDYPNKTGELSILEGNLGKPIASVSIFKQFGGYNNILTESDLAYVKSKNIKLQIAWEPWNPSEGMHQSIDYLKEISEGKQDAYIHAFAASVKSYGNPVILRFGHEMNGDWYPWGNRPDEYRSAYRHIVSIFSQESVRNVQWMWCINAENAPLSLIENSNKFYPGDDVVDIIGIDGVNYGTARENGTWRTFTAIFQLSYQYIARTYDKSIVIAETATSEVGGNKAAWITEMFTSLPLSFPKVEMVIWFNINKEVDWRINSSSASFQAFKAAL